MTTPAAQTKSGLKTLKPGEILFDEGAAADSLFIIQNGQIRLFKPKGKGFVELAVLRAGEVIGEMAYFDEDGSGKKRSCSASAITPVEVIEISFTAFGKTMESLNPWFKTIINTLINRLKKTNSRVRELEDNQTTISYTGKHSDFEFLKPNDILKILGTIFLVFKTHGEAKDNSISINRKILNLYTNELYQISEAKLETVLNILQTLGWFEIAKDRDGLPNVLNLKDIETLRQVFIFYNSEKHLQAEKKLKLGERCEALVEKMISQGGHALVDIAHAKEIDGVPAKFTKYYVLNPVIDELREEGKIISPEYLADGKNVGLFGDVVVKDADFLVEIDYPKLQKLYPVIRFMSEVRKAGA